MQTVGKRAAGYSNFRTQCYVDIRLQMYVYSIITRTQQATCNVLLAISFDSKIGPSSGYYIRTVKLETVCVIRNDISPLH